MWMIVIALVMMVVSILMMPKIKTPTTSNTAQEMETPTNDAGKTMAVVFGEIVVKSPNVIYFGDKNMNQFEVDAS